MKHGTKCCQEWFCRYEETCKKGGHGAQKPTTHQPQQRHQCGTQQRHCPVDVRQGGPVDRSTQVRNDDGVVSETHSAMITREPTHSVGTPGMVMLTDVVSKLTS